MDYYELDVVLNTQKYELMQKIAEEYNVDIEELWGQYKACITANFERDLRDLAKDME